MDTIAYSLSKKFTKDTASSLGSLEGAPCTIKSITDIPGGKRITFEWEGTGGAKDTGYMDVKDGVDGIDAVQITGVSINENKQIVLIMDDGSEYATADPVPTVKGDNGYSPSATATRDTDGIILTVRDKSGTTQAKANDGVSPTVTMRRNATNTGVDLTITDAQGEHTATINDGSVSATVDYSAQVLNKPKINNVEVSGNKSLAEYGVVIPTKNSQLQNDSGFITESAIPSVDAALSLVSVNSVQNKVITAEVRQTQDALNNAITDIGANADAIEILNGNSTVVGSVDKKIADALSNLDRLTKQIVSTLPPLLEAVENIIYLVPNQSGTSYAQWTIVDDGAGGKEWAHLGSTDVDLTDYYNKTQADELLAEKQATITGAGSTITSMNLSANKALVSNANGKVGASSITVSELEALDNVSGNIQEQLDGKQATLEYDTKPTTGSQKMLKSGAIKESLDTKQGVLTFDETPTALSPNPVKSGGMYTALQGKNDKFQYDELPIASVDLLGKIYQYTGATTATLKNGYFYKCVLNEDTATYEWAEQASGDSNVQSDWAETDTSSDSYIQNKPTLGTASEKDSTDVIRPNNHDVAESGSTYNAITGAVASVYEPRVPITVAELTSALLIADNIGTVYKATTSGTTTADFIQGADIPIEIGDCIGVLKVGATDIKFNLMGQTMDLHDLQPKQLATPLTIDGQEQTSVEGALGALNRQTNFADNPIGTILPYGGSTVPTGWLLCDGSAVSRTTYSDLFGVIGTSFGAGNGSTTFNLPDMRESVPKGAGLTGKTVGAHLDADGLAVGEFLDDRVQTHIHSMGDKVAAGAGPGSLSQHTQIQASAIYADNYNTASNSGRKGDTTEVKSVGVNYIIKAKMVALPADFMSAVEEAIDEKTTDTVTSGSTDLITSGGVYNAFACTPITNPSASSSLRGASNTFDANTNTDLPTYNTGAGTLYLAMSGLGAYKIDISFNANGIIKLDNAIGISDIRGSVSNNVGTITATNFTMTLTRISNAIRINCTRSGKVILNYMWI